MAELFEEAAQPRETEEETAQTSPDRGEASPAAETSPSGSPPEAAESREAEEAPAPEAEEPPEAEEAAAPEPDAPDPDDVQLPKYAVPVFFGAIALIAALIVVLFIAPGPARSRSAAGSAPEPFSSAQPQSPSSSAPSSSAPSYSTIDDLPDFVLYGVTPYLMKVDEPYSYMTEDIDERGTSLVGVITARSYDKGDPSPAAQAFAAEFGRDLTGFESRRVVFEISFDDGYPDVGFFCTDYYNAAAFESEFDGVGVSADGQYEYYAGEVSVNGEERQIYLLLRLDYDYEDSFLAVADWEVIVPEGYDGVCIGYYNTMLEQSEDYQNADTVLDCFDRDNMFFFRCA